MFLFSGCKNQNVGSPGRDIAHPIATDADDCARRCDSNPQCKAWTFNPNDMRCWIKNKFVENMIAPGLWSGVKGCDINNTAGRETK